MFKEFTLTRVWLEYRDKLWKEGQIMPPVYNKEFAEAMLAKRWTGISGKIRKVKDFGIFVAENTVLRIGGI